MCVCVSQRERERENCFQDIGYQEIKGGYL